MSPKALERALPQVTASERELFSKAACWNEQWTWQDLTEDVLRRIAAQEGIDFATALLYDRILHWPRQAEFLEQLANSASGTEDVLIAIAPGAFYLEDKRSGADGRAIIEIAKTLGCRAERVPLGSFGRLMENAQILCDWLGQRKEQKIVLVSLSKGGAEVKLALAESPEIFQQVIAWIDLSGLHFGTPLMNWLLPRRWRMLAIRMMFWFQGYDVAALPELERCPGTMLDFALQAPEHLRIVHVVGFPLRRHLSRPRSRRGFQRIAPMGPNDGGAILLADLARLPGLIYPLWGADHFLKPVRDLQPLVTQLLNWIMKREPDALARDFLARASGSENVARLS
jgi:hypothetical protein